MTDSTTKVLSVDTRCSASPRGWVELGAPRDLMKRLLALGFLQLDLSGLERVGCRLADGQVWDVMPLRIEEDVMNLAHAYQQLKAEVGQAGRVREHWAFLNNGTFDIRARRAKEMLEVHVGEIGVITHRGGDEPPGVLMSDEEYVGFWNCIALGLVRPLRGGS